MIFKRLTLSTTLIVTIIVAVSILSAPKPSPTNFFQNHGYFFLFAISFMPRLTLLFSSVATGGLVWWLGFFFCPRVLVACLATVTYFTTNPILVYVSWVIAVSGELLEKRSVGNNRFVFRYMKQGPSEQPRPSGPSISRSDAIEAEFTRKE